MKKWLIAGGVLAFALILGLGIYLIVSLSGLSGSERTTAPSTGELPDVLTYAQENWPDYLCEYDEQAHRLTLRYATATSIDSARRFGAEVYSGETAPETYLTVVRMIALSVASDCGVSDIQVTLQYDSSEGEPIFSIGDDGTIWHCWEE